ncbi:MAG: hypothetical protein IJI10_04655 [Eubacterium sp.]|nr:hypothetical protein [Eubacterium sp.]
MEKLDHGYLNDLVVKAGNGNSNAFAELYAAVAGRQYAYLCAMVRDPARAESLLQTLFEYVINHIGTLQRADLFLCWISREAFRLCHDTPEGADAYDLYMNLPLGESQVLLMHEAQGLSIHETGDILNLGSRTIRRRLRSGRRHLQQEFADAGDRELHDNRKEVPDGVQTRDGRGVRNPSVQIAGGHIFREKHEPDAFRMAEILWNVFQTAGWEPNSVPIEALSSYAVYRKERFSLQRGVLIAAMVLFLLLPGLFVLPAYQVTYEQEGVRGLPVYRIDVHSLLPVGRVTAAMQQHRLPVYEAGSRSFTVEPIRNGKLTIEVALVNRQTVQTTEQVTDVDAESPKLTGSEVGEDTFLLHVEDAGIGVNYSGIYAVGESGEVYRPVSVSEAEGVLFSYPEEAWDVYIPDHIGNILHLKVHFE